MPAATVTITPGYLPPDGTPITCAILRQIAQPSASANFTIPPATLNFLQNGNFYKSLWANLSGISATSVITQAMLVANPQGWVAQAMPTGAGDTMTVLSSTDVPNLMSYYSMEVDLTSAQFTAFGIYQQIPSDVASVLNGQQVTISFWIKNIQSGTFTPTVNFVCPNSQDAFSGAVTNIAATPLQSVAQGTWTKMSATVTLSNALINNGLQLEIDFPLASLTALAGGTVQFRFSQFFLQIGNVSTAFQSDPALINEVPTAQQTRILFGPTGSVVSTMNGDMQVWQRGTSFAAVANLAKVSDRYSIQQSMVTGVATVSQQAVEFPQTTNQYPHTKYATRITVTTLQASITAPELFALTHRIERQYARALFDGSHSLSLVLQSSVVGIYCVAIRSATPGGASFVYECPVGVVNVPLRFTFPNTPPLPPTTPGGNWGTADTDFCYEITIAAACGGNFQIAPGVWSIANALATSNQKNLFAVNGSTLDVALIQHEAGPICTPFLWKPFSERFRDCQRYYFRSVPYGALISATQPGFLTWICYSAAAAAGTNNYPVQMRIAGTPTYYNYVTVSTSTVYDLNSAASIGSAATFSLNSEKGCPNLSFTSGGTAGHIIAGHVTNDVEF